MRVRAIRGRKGDVICRFNGAMTGLFDKRGRTPTVGEELDVMLCAPIWTDPGQDIKTFIVMPVTTDHLAICHFGFRLDDNGRFIVAKLHVDSIRKIAEHATVDGITAVTPGRTPVNEGAIHARDGEAYVYIPDLNRKTPRICGVPTLDGISHEVKERFITSIC